MNEQKKEGKKDRKLKRGRGMGEGIKTARPKKTKEEEEEGGEEISPEALGSYLDRQTEESVCQLYLPN